MLLEAPAILLPAGPTGVFLGCLAYASFLAALLLSWIEEARRVESAPAPESPRLGVAGTG